MGEETAKRGGGCSGEFSREVHADSVHSSGVGWGEIAKLRLTTGATEDDLGSTFAPWADTEESRIGQFVKDLEAKTVFAGFSWARSRSAFWGGRRLHWADYLSRNFLQLVSHLGNP